MTIFTVCILLPKIYSKMIVFATKYLYFVWIGFISNANVLVRIDTIVTAVFTLKIESKQNKFGFSSASDEISNRTKTQKLEN